MKVLREHRRTRLSWTPKVSIHISKRREVRTPTVSVRQIVGHEYMVCLNCGYWGKTLRRHITAQRGLSREDGIGDPADQVRQYAHRQGPVGAPVKAPAV